MIIADPVNLEVVNSQILAVFTHSNAKVISNIIGDRIYTFANRGWAGGPPSGQAPVIYIGSFYHNLTQDFYKKFTYKDNTLEMADSDLAYVKIQEFGTKIGFYVNRLSDYLEGVLFILDTSTKTFVFKHFRYFTSFKFNGLSY